jgi:hypothetical protein
MSPALALGSAQRRWALRVAEFFIRSVPPDSQGTV